MKIKLLYGFLLLFISILLFPLLINQCGNAPKKELNSSEYNKMIDYAKENNSTALSALMFHYLSINETEAANFYYVALREQGNLLSQYDYEMLNAYAIENNETAIYKIRGHKIADEIKQKAYYSLENNLSAMKRFILACSIDRFCSDSDMYEHFNAIYQSLSDENKTAIDQAISKQERDEIKTESCGFFASIHKFFVCG
ncbi:MAG: hypothetical protein LBC09_03315 [Helicobacteraceae bacterium]|jgi:hypothetical protein|nr:hypothetical protein [Helicobacteraceae bacterium]